MRYKDEKEIETIIRSFEDATIARDVWTHAEHLVVALHYLERHDFDAAYARMCSGIFNLLTNGFGVDLTKEMPYHETITMFWMRTVADFRATSNGGSMLEKTNEIVELYDKDYPERFYSRDLLFSDEARKRFVGGDIVAT